MQGFTLVELVLSIAIIAVLTVTAVRMVSRSRMDLDAISKGLRSNVQLAQDLAMTHAAVYGFTTLSTTSYQIFSGAAGTPAKNPLTGGNFNVSIAPIQFVGTVPSITFAATGKPTMAADAVIQLSDGVNSIRVRVARTTGYVSFE